MSIHFAEAELAALDDIRTSTAPPQPLCDDIEVEDDDRLAVVRGVLGAVIISTPIWMLIGFTIFMLL
jgi:hypothetical protein